MKVLFVTSEITYMPENYLQLIEGLLKECPQFIHGFCFIKNSDYKLLFKSLGLVALGSKGIGKDLLKNIASSHKMKREALIKQYNKKIISTHSVNSFSFIEYVKENEIDLIINIRTRCIYKKAILSIPRFGCINVHHGLLPKYRGTMCDLYAILDKRPAGFSIHKMTSKVDAGDIIIKKIVSENNHPSEYSKYLKLTIDCEIQTIKSLLESINENNALPKGEKNDPSECVYSKTPNIREIKKFKQAGIIV